MADTCPPGESIATGPAGGTSTSSVASAEGEKPQGAGPLVFVVDDDESVRTSLARLFKSASYQAETFASAEEFLRRERYEGPACLVLDVCLPGLNGLGLQQSLAATDYQLPIVFITGHGDVPMSVEAIKAGAVDFLTKPFSDEDLIRAVEDAIAKCRKERGEHATLGLIKQRLSTLTPREYEVLHHVLAGKINKRTAAELDITERTVKEHRHRIIKKMHVGSLAELVRLMESPGIE